MARGPSANYGDQRELILSKAAELFAARGYPGTSMNEVAEACGLSKPALYHYFRDKNAMLVTIAEGHVMRLEAMVKDALQRQLPAKARLEQLIRAFVAEYAGAQNAHRVLTEDVRFLEPEDRERTEEKEKQPAWIHEGSNLG